MSNDKNRKTEFEIVQYGSGPWNGKWVVRETIQQDVCACLTREDALVVMKKLQRNAGS